MARLRVPFIPGPARSNREFLRDFASSQVCPRGLLWAVVVLFGTAGCRQRSPQVAPAEIPTVPVSHPAARQVTDYVDFTGRAEATQSVNVIARVTGYLIRMPFKEGSEVKKGDLLFEIDPGPYQAQLDQAKSQVSLYQAQLKLARTTLARDQSIARAGGLGAVSQQQLDQDQAAVDEAQERVKAYQASTEVYKLNLSFTRVTSPIDGQVSRYYLTVGNLVNQDQTLLTTVVSLDPMYAYFDMDERTLLDIRKAIADGKIAVYADGAEIPVLMGLQNEDGFPHRGTIDFVNNQIDSTTGSITLRGVFSNPRLVPPTASTVAPAQARESPRSPGQNPVPGAGGKQRVPRWLSPGMFLRIRLPIGQAHEALLVIDRAIQSDQGLKYVYVVDAERKIQTRSVKTGALQEDGLRVVEGVKADDWVVVGGLQQLRARMPVHVEERPMPSLGPRPEAENRPADPTKAQPKSRQPRK